MSKALDQAELRVPIIGDFHYNGHILLKKYPDSARALAKYRINPGMFDSARKTTTLPHHDRVRRRESASPCASGQLGILDQALLTRIMDENSSGRIRCLHAR